MCLILFRFAPGTDLPLVVAANRDEAYARATAAATYWQDQPEILAGRDLEAGGSWLGVNKQGQFAALTNFRQAEVQAHQGPSRGELVAGFLANKKSAAEFMADVEARAEQYAGFNLLIGDQHELIYFSNRSNSPSRNLEPACYGLSNGLLDSQWPKIDMGKKRLQACIDSGCHAEDLQMILLDDAQYPLSSLPDTGVGEEIEQLLSPLFIKSEVYGTRSSSLVIHRDSEIEFHEFNYPGGNTKLTETRRFTLKL